MEKRIFKAVEGAVKQALEQLGTEEGNSISCDDLDEALASIIVSYSNSGLDTEYATQLNFGDAAHRWAYAYLYMSSHTHVVLDILGEFWRNSSALDSWHNALSGRQMRVCCVGGGPGSDLLAVALFVRKQRLRVAGITVDVLDQWDKWEETFIAVSNRLDPARVILPQREDVKYQSFHFDQEQFSVEAIQEADLITMVKFISAASADRDFCQEQLAPSAHLEEQKWESYEALLQHMKPGAVLFVLDNAGGGYLELADHAAEEAELDKLIQLCHKEMELDDKERNAMNSSSLCHMLMMHPQKSSKVSAAIWQKRSDLNIQKNGSQPNPLHQYYSASPHRCSKQNQRVRSQSTPEYYIVPPTSPIAIPASGTYAKVCKSYSPPFKQNWSTSSASSASSTSTSSDPFPLLDTPTVNPDLDQTNDSTEEEILTLKTYKDFPPLPLPMSASKASPEIGLPSCVDHQFSTAVVNYTQTLKPNVTSVSEFQTELIPFAMPEESLDNSNSDLQSTIPELKYLDILLSKLDSKSLPEQNDVIFKSHSSTTDTNLNTAFKLDTNENLQSSAILTNPSEITQEELAKSTQERYPCASKHDYPTRKIDPNPNLEQTASVSTSKTFSGLDSISAKSDIQNGTKNLVVADTQASPLSYTSSLCPLLTAKHTCLKHAGKSSNSRSRKLLSLLQWILIARVLDWIWNLGEYWAW